MASQLPIAGLLPAITRSLAAHPRLVLEAPPGAGKTTAVPPALLAAPWLEGRRVLVLEPRRLAARAAAEFMARQRGEPVGAGVGYRVRFDQRVSAATRIEVITEGIFVRRIQADPMLEDVGAVLFDEFHERHLAADLGLALARDVQAGLRPGLRLVVMSATLDGAALATALDAPRLTSAGRSHPVSIRHPAMAARLEPLQQLARVVPQALAEVPGDVLVFLPGQREIRRAARLLEQAITDPDVLVLPLHGALPLAAQRAALRPPPAGTRHVILATNVAESSITLPGIRCVIDLGLAREPRFDPRSGLTRLETVFISQASADQRAGRAGRVAPGIALRLWPQSRRLEAARRTEIEHADLTALALELAAWGSAALPWLTPPPAAALAQARDTLRLLGALDADARITPAGQRMLATGGAPRLAAAIVAAPPRRHGLLADLLALLESRSPLRHGSGPDDDLGARLAALHAWRDRGGRALPGVDGARLAAIEETARGWRQRLGTRDRPSGTPGRFAAAALLLPAFPDRVAHMDADDPAHGKLAAGRGLRLAPDSALLGEPWLLAVEVQLERGDSRLRAALPLDAEALEQRFPARFTTRRRSSWDGARQVLDVFEERCFGAIVVARKRVQASVAERQAACLAQIRAEGADALPWSAATRALQARVRCLAQAMPELALPPFDDTALGAQVDTWLAPWLTGAGARLTASVFAQALATRLDRAQREAVDRHAPERIAVPSGNRHRIDYTDPAAPVLAVKLQELFGLQATPTIAAGRVPLTLHLLSPAGRPMQVTQDLASFWRQTYAEVRKDLRGRYPKHPWPEDPLQARPTARTRRHSH